jgi:hypothetical protein
MKNQSDREEIWMFYQFLHTTQCAHTAITH